MSMSKTVMRGSTVGQLFEDKEKKEELVRSHQEICIQNPSDFSAIELKSIVWHNQW